MRLNVQTDYALRLLMQLGVANGSLVTIADVADRFNVSKNHLMKVAHLLGRAGFIDTVRGRAGGLRLALPASEINVGAVVREMEADFTIVECFRDGKAECLITPSCRLKSVLNAAVNAFLEILDEYSLDDLIRRNPTLRNLLTSDAA